VSRGGRDGPADKGRRRSRGVWIAACAVAVLAVAAIAIMLVTRRDDDPGPGKDTVRVSALWYGQAADGSIRTGVTPVDITPRLDDPRTPLSLDQRGTRAAGAGPAWRAATAVALAQAVLIAGVDPRLGQIKYALKESIDGASAGGLLSAGTLAALHGTRVRNTATMTGAVLPDGSIGPVDGVAAKVQAAKDAGFDRVLVPVGEARDLVTDDPVDLEALARKLHVQVTPVTSVPDAYALLTGARTTGATATNTRAPTPIDPGLLAMLTRRSRALLAATPQPPATAPATTRTNVRAWRATARRALAAHDPVRAFAAAAEAAQAAREETAVARLRAAARRGASLPSRIAQVRTTATRSAATITAALRATAQTPVTKIAQLAALPDVLSWGVYGLTASDVARERLSTVRTEAQLEEVVRFLATARFEAGVYLPATAAALPYIGRTTIDDVPAKVGLFDAYAGLLADAANANRTYARSLQVDDTAYLSQLIDAAHTFTGATPPVFRDLRGRTAQPALRMAAALLEYVETTQLTNDLTAPRDAREDRPPNLLPIKSVAAVRTEAATAAAITRDQARTLTAAGRNPSYLQWNSRWGELLAFRRLPRTTDEQALHGLEYQWFAVLQSRLLTALGGR
jgi:hypothetical protein